MKGDNFSEGFMPQFSKNNNMFVDAFYQTHGMQTQCKLKAQ